MRFYLVLFILFISLSAYAESEMVGKWDLGGMFFKDKLIVKAFEDPKVKGVTCYVTSVSKSLSFEDPDNTAISCVKTGRVIIDRSVDLSPEGEIITSERKSLVWKKMKIRRIYDLNRNILLYVSYVTEMIDGSFKISMSAVSCDP
jgi:CreA protein